MNATHSINHKMSPADIKLDGRTYAFISLYACIFISFFSSWISTLSALYYLVSILNIVVLIFKLKEVLALLNNFPAIALILGVQIVYGLSSATIHSVPILNVIWSSLSLTRPIVFGLLVCTCWNRDDFSRVFRQLYNLQWVNLFLVAFEFMFLGSIQDTLGGIFGTWMGCNIPLNIYMCFVCTISASAITNSHFGIPKSTAAVSIASLLIMAGLAEIKFFYFEFLIIVLGMILLNRISLKMVGLLLLCVMALCVGLYIFSIVMPDRFRILTDFQLIYKEANLRGAGYGVSRIEVFSQLSNEVFFNNPNSEMFGLGLGSASSSTFNVFNSAIAKQYSYLNYDILQSAILFIQGGYLGVALFIALPAFLMLHSFYTRSVDGYIKVVCAISCLLFIANIFYNDSASSVFSCLWAVAIFSAISNTDKKVSWLA